MTAFLLPLTIRAAAGDTDLLLEMAEPVALGTVLPDLLACAGLPADTVLHLGEQPVDRSLPVGRPPLLAGAVLSTLPVTLAAGPGSLRLLCIAGPDAGGSVTLGQGTVVVGRDPGCGLVVDDPELSRRHAAFRRTGERLAATDLRSANGVRVTAATGDGAGDATGFRDAGGTGVSGGSGDAVVSRRPGVRAGEADREGALPPRDNRAAAVQPLPPGAIVRLGGSLFRASPDIEPRLVLTPDDAGHLVVTRPARVNPPFHRDLGTPVGDAPTRNRRPLPLLAAVLGAVVGAAIALLTGMWTFLLLATLGPVLMLAGALSDSHRGRRGHRRATSDHRRRQADWDAVLGEAVDADRRDAWDRHPDPATLMRRALHRSVRLWERRPGDPEFLLVTCGVGDRPARLVLPGAPLVCDVPIVLDLAEIGVLGIAGAYRPLLRHLLAQLVCLHSPADLRLCVLSQEADVARLRDLPHSVRQDAAGPLGRPAGWPADGRLTVLVLDDANRWRRAPGVAALLAGAAGPPGLHHRRRGTVVVCAARREQELPLECAAVATVAEGRVRVAAGETVRVAEMTGVSTGYLDLLVSQLAPLVDPDTPDGGLPRSMRLSEVLPGGVVTALAEAWSRPRLAAVLGAGTAGPVTVDLERDGPHALVAGTTGAGKSELLRTMIAGLAAAAPPSRTALVLIDYKGGAAFGRLALLPHTTGVVTDLDPASGARALTGLRAELRRREQLLADAGAADLVALRAAGVAPPSLVIVVDEFATLASELPDFLSGLLDVAQRGRSLGLHLVLATQRPAGVLSPAMRANINLRICLRVLDDTDSLDVIETPDAARLDPAVPGRAYLRTGGGSPQLLQVATVSAAAPVPWTVRRRDPGEGSAATRRADLPQRGATDPRAPGATEPARHGASDLDSVVAAAVSAARGQPAPVAAWLPPLPTDYRPADPQVIGLVDRPDQQSRSCWPAPPGSVLVLGPPRSGRSCALRRFGWSAAAAGTELLVVDMGGTLSDLARWPATSTYLRRADAALVQRLARRLHDEAQALHGAAGGRGRRPVLLLIDGWDVLSRELDALDHGATSAVIPELAGGAGGIRVVVSGDFRWQHSRLADSFLDTVRLSVDDRGDPVAGPAGRGRVGGWQVQLAHSPAGSAPPPSDAAGTPDDTTVGARQDRPRIVVRALPGRVLLDELPAPTAAAVPVGIGGDDASTVTLDLTGATRGLLVAGPRRSGVSNTLAALACGAAAAGVPVLRAAVGPGPTLPGVEHLVVGAGAGGLMTRLVEHSGPLLLVADEVDRWTDDGAALLERFLTAAAPGQYLALGVRLDRALRSHRGPVAELAALRTGVLLQADSSDGVLLDATLERRRGPAPPGRGHLVVDGSAVPVQVALASAGLGPPTP